MSLLKSILNMMIYASGSKFFRFGPATRPTRPKRTKEPKAMVLEAKIPDISIKAKRPPISPPFNLSKLDLIKSIDRKKIVAFREEIFKKVNG